MINKEYWQKLSLFEQLGNIGSEVARAKFSEDDQDQENRNHCLMRALELVNLTIDDGRWRVELKEIKRLKEIINDWYIGRSNFKVSPAEIEEYLMPFAIYARQQKLK